MKKSLDDIRGMPDEFIIPEVAAGIIGCSPQALRDQARTDKTALGFPVTVIGTRVYIPRQSFVKFVDGGTNDGL